jgi:hypothetical protein
METSNELHAYERRTPRSDSHTQWELVHCLWERASVYLRAIGRSALWVENERDIQGH